ncbi:Retrovirus-related Pol polyprotein from transposon 297 [Vitis vinifera]|uniref:Retrovirus-related Pol polyprotein from transposon 297 n=1 Tax=Vitis vinifera TaxID=29760 RepID=A0A438K0A2_VITVI|nr:Retrovirus-related Pol polyprotein from transposon 297 [Vitis vinifera]
MIKQVPTYAKFLKNLCTIKRGLNVNKKAFLIEQVSAIIQCKSPVKYKDPSCPTISVSVGGTCVEKNLLDLGASVNLLPYSVYKQLGLGELKPTSITLSLADRPMKIPRGMIEDFLVQEDLVESFGDLDEGLLEPSDLLATLSPWRRREEILPLFNEEETQRSEDCLLEVLRRRKKAIGWQISDLKGISPLVCTHHIYMEDEAKPVRQPQRRLNLHIPWVSPTQVVPKKSRITVMKNDKGEDVSTRLTIGWRVLERVSGHHFYCFLDGYSYFQIEIDVEDQEKTTSRAHLELMHTGELFMDDIIIYGSTFEECLVNLEVVLNRCIEKDLVLNWKKCHFMVHQGIVLGHIISKQDIEVDKAKVELIVKLPSPTNVKGVRQFFGHAEFYRRFIKDFSKFARPLCELLVNEAKFI